MKPEPGTVERWAHDYIQSTDLAEKLVPGPVPPDFQPDWRPLNLSSPGRPASVQVSQKGHKTPGPEALRKPERRAQLLHTFLHHELQAAELMCWALLRFADAPLAFRRGLLGVCRDELKHMGLYAQRIEELGFRYGDFPVNDWFWQRVPAAATPVQFVALLGLGFEGGNLDHTERFAERFERVGDERSAALQRLVGEEEVRHVAFAAHWFKTWTSGLRFDDWIGQLPAPLSPMVMRGTPLNRAARRRAGVPEAFLARLQAWQPVARGS